MAAPAAVLSILVRANTGQATTGLLKVNQQLGSTEKRANKMSGAFNVLEKTAGIAALGIGAGLAYSVKKAANFEAQISSLGAVADASGREMERFRKQALKAGADTKFSALEAAQAQTELAKGGLSVRQIMRGGLRSALALAAAGEMELADAAETTANAIKLFGLRGKDSVKVADALATAANRTTADVSDFALALKMGGSVAKLAGLSFNESVVVLEALAEAGIKGSDAGTSMKSFFLNLTRDAPKAKEAMKKLGVEIFDQQGQLKSLPDISRNLQHAFGDLTREQFLNKAGVIAGSDAVRTLWALYDAGPKKLGGLEKATAKHGTAAETAKKKQDNLKGSVEQLGGSVETLGITIGTAALPMIRELADDVTGLVNKISKIAQRDDLSVGEKISKSFEMAKIDAQPWIDKITAAVEQADLPKRLADALSAATPVIGAAAGKAAVVAAKGFGRGFLESGAWGRLLIGGWLLSKMGGLGAFTRLGQAGGAKVGEGIATGMTSGGVKGRIAGVMKGLGKTVIAASLINGAAEGIKATEGDLGFNDKITQIGHGLSFGAFGQDVLEGMEQDFARLRDAITRTTDLDMVQPISWDKLIDTTKLSEQQRTALEGLLQFRRDAKAAVGDLATRGITIKVNDQDAIDAAVRVTAALKRMESGSSTSIKQLRGSVRDGMAVIKRDLGKKSAEGKEALSANFRAAITNVKTSMKEGKLTTKEGTAEIARLMRRALAVYGIKGKDAARYMASPVGDTTGKDHGAGSRSTFQRGGPINMGSPSGDSVPAMLERGEYVLNRNAVGKVGRKALDTLNFGAAPRFQSGGVVALGRQLQKQGYEVGEHPAFGGVHAVHAKNSYHYRGMALDVNDDDAPGGEAGSLDKLYRRLKNMPGVVELLWRVADHFDHLHVAMSGAGGPLGALGQAVPKLKRVMASGPDSALKAIVQGALDTTLAGAQHRLDSVAATMSVGPEGAEPGGAVSGNGAALMKQIAKRRGWNFADWWTIDGRETGHGADLLNESSGALNRGQFLGANIGAYGPGSRRGASMAEQIQSMAAYIADRYGNPTAARKFHDAHNWYAAGGPVGMQAGGFMGMSTFANRFGLSPATGTGAGGFGLGKALEKVRTGKSPKIRNAAVRGLVDRIKDIDLPRGIQKALASYGGDANIFGDYADRAASLTDESAITEALEAEMARRQKAGLAFPDTDQQAMVDSMIGRVGGKGQLDWLTDQLGALFNWRNTIIDAEKVVVQRREETTRLIAEARARLERVREQIREAAARRKALEKQLAAVEKALEKARKHPKKNKAQIEALKGQEKGLNADIRGVDKAQRPRLRVRDALKEKIIPALTGKRESLNTARGDLLTSLGEAQGIGSPMERLAAVPAMGVLGGRIFDAQLRIKDLTDKPIRVIAEAAPTDDTSASAGWSINQLLDWAYLHNAVSGPGVPFGGSFATGGVVAGPQGAPRIIEAHGGEGVFTPEQMAAIGGTTMRGNIEVHVQLPDALAWMKDQIRVEIRESDRTAKGAYRAGVVSS